MNNESKLTKWSIIILFVLIAMYFATPARAAPGDNFTNVWYLTNAEFLEKYLNYEDKESWDKRFEYWIDGAAAGVFTTYNYQAGIGPDIAGCAYNSEVLSPTSMRKAVLRAGINPILKDLAVGTYVYSMLHFACEDILGEYEYADGDDTEVEATS